MIKPDTRVVTLWGNSGPDTFTNLTQDKTDVDFTALFPSPSIIGVMRNLLPNFTGVTVTIGGSGLSNKPCDLSSSNYVVTYTCSGLNIYGDYIIVSSSAYFGEDERRIRQRERVAYFLRAGISCLRCLLTLRQVGSALA